MEVKKIHCYLVNPKKSSLVVSEIKKTQIKKGPTWDFLSSVFANSAEECNIAIDFIPDADTGQTNNTRKALVACMTSPTIAKGKALAALLEFATPHQAGLGLLFIMHGQENGRNRVVMARFKAENGLVADDTTDQLSVNFRERIFLKNRRHYKSVMYEAKSSRIRSILSGKAVDLQDNSDKELSDYWIFGFLHSDFASKSIRGSRILGEGVKRAFNKTDSDAVREEIQSLLTLLPNKDGHQISASRLKEIFHISNDTEEAIKKAMRKDTFEMTFVLDKSAFQNMARFKTIHLDNGAILTAPTDKFEETFNVRSSDGIMQISAQGSVLDVKIRRSS